MQKSILLTGIIAVLLSCGDTKGPDVSSIKADLQTQRFEQDFFAMDTSKIDVSLQRLHEKYPGFLQDFLFNILALPAESDSTLAVEQTIKSFIATYQPVKDSADKVFENFEPIAKELEAGLKHVKYYFPNYPLPEKVITFIGPINSFGNILTANSIAVGLQLYMGKAYTLYQSEAGQQLYPLYISARFQPEYIVTGSIKNIINDMYPEDYAGQPLVHQMIEAGKRLYVLDKLLPETADTIKTGYTAAQLKGSYDNEAFIWSFFLQNDMLYKNDPSITKDYMTDGPKTAVLGEASPGYIGQFVGWQLVKKWMEKNEEVTLPELMTTNPGKIFEEAKYKPR